MSEPPLEDGCDHARLVMTAVVVPNLDRRTVGIPPFAVQPVLESDRMFTLKSLSRRAAVLGLLCAVVLSIAGCGGGTAGGPSGSLWVSASYLNTTDSIYRVDVTENFAPFGTVSYDFSATSSPFINVGDTVYIGDFVPGPYTVEVFWFDGTTYWPTPDSDPTVVISDGLDTYADFPS